jgi:hypothetical protein
MLGFHCRVWAVPSITFFPEPLGSCRIRGFHDLLPAAVREVLTHKLQGSFCVFVFSVRGGRMSKYVGSKSGSNEDDNIK